MSVTNKLTATERKVLLDAAYELDAFVKMTKPYFAELIKVRSRLARRLRKMAGCGQKRKGSKP